MQEAKERNKIVLELPPHRFLCYLEHMTVCCLDALGSWYILFFQPTSKMPQYQKRILL